MPSIAESANQYYNYHLLVFHPERSLWTAVYGWGQIGGYFVCDLRQIGKPTGEIDALIGAVARSGNDILVTNNIKDFENILNLQLENWRS